MFDENDVFVQYVTKNIEDIKVGDFVYSYDTITGEVSLREVTATFVREVDHINYLTILDEFGNEQVIATTDSHPFWVVTDEPDLERAARGTVDENGVILYHENIDPGLHGFWVEAKDLREGDIVLGANGELSTLVSQERVEFEERITVYNFTVDGNHNYFVIAATDEFGQTCVLVHNANYGGQSLWERLITLLGRLGQTKERLRIQGEEYNNIVNGTVEYHHLLPKQFEHMFKDVDLDIEEYKIPLDKVTHRLKPDGVHTGKREDSWNGQWQKFFDKNKNPTAEEILEQLAKMREAFGI